MDQQNYYSAPPAQPNTLVLGILSIVLGSIVGIILGAIGRKKGKAFINQGGVLTGASKIGYILCLVGLILSIISTVSIAIYALVAIIAIIAGGASGGFSSFNYY